MARTTKVPKDVQTITHDETRRHIPTAEHQPIVRDEDAAPVPAAFERRNPDLDPQLVWRGKDTADWSDLVVQAPPIYIQEKVHPKVLIDDLMRQTEARADDDEDQIDLFADFNGVPDGDAKTEFYQHDANWTNRLILGDSLQVMASLAEREGLRGQVQCIYLDPPYGIKFNSNFQWSTTTRDVKDGKAEHVTREPEQVKAFRDTWRDGIHSYLTYLRDRLTVCRDLLHESGSIFVQIGDENVHRVRALMDEVFGEDRCVSQIAFRTTTGRASGTLAGAANYLLWYTKGDAPKYRELFDDKADAQSTQAVYSLVRDERGASRRLAADEREDWSQIPDGLRVFRADNITSARSSGGGDVKRFEFQGETYTPGRRTFMTNAEGLERVAKADRIWPTSTGSIQYVRFFDDFPIMPMANVWTDTGTGSFTDAKVYVVQTGWKVIERCVLMTTDPGDLVLDPTCGSGTTAAVAEEWGRRWITIDTSRVALALARARIMGARYPFYLLKDSPEGQRKEAKVTRRPPSTEPTAGNVRQGFVYERAPHIMLSDIANNAEIDVIWEQAQETLEPLLEKLNNQLGRLPRTQKKVNSSAPQPLSPSAPQPLAWREWEVPRQPGDPWPDKATTAWEKFRTADTDKARSRYLGRINKALGRSYALADVPDQPFDLWDDAEAARLHRQWWDARIARQREIDASIAAAADFEYLYDRPYQDKTRVRVAGPFTVESLAPHRTLAVGPEGDVIDHVADARAGYGGQDFPSLIIEALRKSGVQQTHREDRIEFDTLTDWPGQFVSAVGETTVGGERQRAGVFVGPEFGTVGRQELVRAAREAADAGLDTLVACAFSFEAHATEFETLGRVRVLKATMNADLHMAADLANTGSGNLFVLFGEPDITVDRVEDGRVQVQIHGVDVFDPSTGKVRSGGTDGIACWFVDTDYNEESFFVRHAYFLGAGDPYKSLKTTLKAEIDEDAWASLYGDTSRPFAVPSSGRIAVKVINHLGDEVMKVFRVGQA